MRFGSSIWQEAQAVINGYMGHSHVVVTVRLAENYLNYI